MSGEGPESIPTSADPRSKRPTKRRALTPSSAHAASVDSLFAKPDQKTGLPELSSAVAARRAAGVGAPEIVTNVQGSSAGAGSGEFHVYKAARRREYERLRAMDELVQAEKASEEFEREKVERDAKDEERTRKNREKRDKKKKRKGAGGGGAGGGPKGPVPKIAKRELSKDDDEGDTPRAKDDATAQSAQDGEKKEDEEALPATTGLVIHDDD